VCVVTIVVQPFASFDPRMVPIRIDNEPELKIEDAMQVKGRRAAMPSAARPARDHVFRSRAAA